MFASTSKLFSSSAAKQSSKQGSKNSSTTPLIPSELEDMYDEDDGLPDVIYVIPMRVTGFLLLAFGIAELVIGLKIYDVLTNVTLGSWWCVPVVFICAVLALVSNSKSVVIGGLIFALVGCIFTLIASIVDGGAAHTFYNYKACFSPSSGTVYGDQSYSDFLLETCDSGSNADVHLCYCASDDDKLCWEYDLSSSKHTCNILLTTYPDWLVLSFSFCTVCLFLCLVYLTLTSVSAFCLKMCVKRKGTTEEQQ